MTIYRATRRGEKRKRDFPTSWVATDACSREMFMSERQSALLAGVLGWFGVERAVITGVLMCPKLLVRNLHPIRNAFPFEDPRHTRAFHREQIRALPLQAETVTRGKHNKWRMLFTTERHITRPGTRLN
jgi:hypothetical protein